MPETIKKKVIVKKPKAKAKAKCIHCKGKKKTVKGGQSGGCGCSGMAATPPV
jgi:hypothetical protein